MRQKITYIYILINITIVIISCRGSASSHDDKTRIATKDVNHLYACIDFYLQNHSRMPGSIYSAVEEWGGDKTFNLSAKEKNDKLVLDPWGNPYQLKSKIDSAVVYSFGPNLLDDSGNGDDIVRCFHFK